jgi:PKD repeat protein
MLFDVDCYSSWMSYGVSNICFLEMLTTPFVGGGNPLVRGETFYGIKTLHQIAMPGDMLVNSTSDRSTLRVQATRQQNGNVGLLLLNENMSATQTVNVTISNAPLTTTGTRYIFGQSNFIASQELPTSAPSSNSVSGVGNSFSVSIPPYTMMVYTIPATVPVASFSAFPTNGSAPLGVTFTDTSTGGTNWSWTFGDGGTTNLATNSVVHSYNTPGVYSVTETVSSLGGSSTDTVANLIGVYDPFVWWQINYFGCTNCPQALPNSDPLGKGINNTNQWLLGLNPTNPASVFRIISLAPQGSGAFVITWSTAGVRTNVVQGATGDGHGGYSNNFSDISGGIIIPIVGDTVINYTDQSGTNRYYRIRLGP